MFIFTINLGKLSVLSSILIRRYIFVDSVHEPRQLWTSLDHCHKSPLEWSLLKVNMYFSTKERHSGCDYIDPMEDLIMTRPFLARAQAACASTSFYAFRVILRFFA